MTNNKIGVLGGTFDPIHDGHLRLAEAVYHDLALDKVLFVPAGEPPHKRGRSITPSYHRAKMAELALEEYPHFEMSRVDLDRPGPHYSVDMVARLRADYQISAHDCFFIIGADSLMDLPTWRAPQQLLNLCRLAVAHRPGYQPDLVNLTTQLPNLPQKIDWVELPDTPISSTSLREAVGRGESIAGYTPQVVAWYIQQARLYR